MFGVTENQKTIATVVATAIVCFCIFMALRKMFEPVEIPQDAKYIKERAELEATAAADAAAKDSLLELTEVLTDSITVLLNKPTEIHYRYETERAENWALSDDSAITLWRTRLAAEDTFRTRFVYGKLRE